MNDRITDPVKAAQITDDVKRIGRWLRIKRAARGEDPEFFQQLISDEVRRQMDERLGPRAGGTAAQNG